MRFTILTDRRSVVMAAALVAMAALPLISIGSADPYAPIRTLVAAVAAGVLCALGTIAPSRTGRAAVTALGLLAVLALAAAATNGLASAVFGVHGRFQGLVSGAALILAACAGMGLRGGHARTLGLSVAAVSVVVSGAVLVQGALGLDPTGWTNNRVVVGGWLAVAVVLSLATAYVSAGRDRWLSFSASVPAAIALGVSGSRGAWIGAVAGLAVLAWGVLGGRPGRLRSVALGLGTLVLAVVLGTAALGGGESAAKLDPRALTGGSAASRWQIWRGAAAMIADAPLLGHGPGRYLYAFPAYQPFEHVVLEAADTRPDQAHSWPLQLAAEAGVPAALLALAVVGLALTTGAGAMRRRDASALIVTAGLAAYAAQSLFSVPAVETDALGWLLVGLALGRSANASGPDGTGGGRAGGRVTGRAKSRTEEPRAAAGVASGRTSVAMLPRAVRVACVSAAVLIAVACGWYAYADAAYSRSLDAFASGDMDAAATHAEVAIARDPLVDVYRVALSDAALYRPDSAERRRVLAVAGEALDAGLEAESASYDLALARARVLAASKATPDEVADAYLAAVDRYPLGVEVRAAAASALRDAGREAEADRIDAELARLSAARGER